MILYTYIMFEPKFAFTMQIVNSVGLIERLYGQLLTEKLIPSLVLQLSEENQVLATHYSTSIEGNPLSPFDELLSLLSIPRHSAFRFEKK